MPLFPLIGYSQAALRAEYERGLLDERLECQQALYNACQQLLPGVTDRFARHPRPNIFVMAQHLVEAISAEMARRHQAHVYLEVESQRLQTKIGELETKLAEFRSDKLMKQINGLTAERDALQRQISELLTQSSRAEGEYTAKLEKLHEEIARLDDLVVKYEHRSRPQNAKH